MFQLISNLINCLFAFDSHAGRERQYLPAKLSHLVVQLFHLFGRAPHLAGLIGRIKFGGELSNRRKPHLLKACHQNAEGTGGTDNALRPHYHPGDN